MMGQELRPYSSYTTMNSVRSQCSPVYTEWEADARVFIHL